MENKAVIINKLESIERCINRIREEYEGNLENLEDYRRNDAIVLNLQRACESVTDIAMYVISTRKLGIPQTKHEYKQIDEEILQDVIENHLDDLTDFARQMLKI